jgi:hypothetical protein
MVFGDGRTAHFWEDRWIAGKSVGELAPALAACIPRRIPRSRTVAAGLQGHSSARDIRGTIGIHEIGQYLMLWRELEQTTRTEQPDTLISTTNKRANKNFSKYTLLNVHRHLSTVGLASPDQI